MKLLALALLAGFSYVCAHPISGEHGDNDHPDHHISARNTHQEPEDGETARTYDETEGDADSLNDVDLDELVEEHDKCESENHPEEEELTIEGKETHKKLSLKDQQKDHKVGKRSAQWGQGHGHHGHRGIREVQTESTGGSTEEEHEHQRSRRSHEEEDKSELEYHHHHHEPLEHADRRRRDVGSHEEHAHNSDEHDENDPQTTEELQHHQEKRSGHHDFEYGHILVKRDEDNGSHHHENEPSFASDDEQHVDSPFE